MLRRLLRAREGVAGAEFALLLPVVALFMLGIVEFGRLFWHRSTLEHAVEETGRYAMAHATADAGELTAVLQQSAAVALPRDAITVSYDRSTIGGIRYLTINASYAFGFVTRAIPLGPITLESTARVPLLL
jgi:Flp pilus assembly protein TadG